MARESVPWGLAAVMDQAGWLGSGTLLASEARLGNSLVPKAPHFAPRAKRVIHLLMNGGVSHVDTFDYKPLLEKYHGQRPAAVDIKTQRKTEGLMKSPFEFQRHGQSGAGSASSSPTWRNASTISASSTPCIPTSRSTWPGC